MKLLSKTLLLVSILSVLNGCTPDVKPTEQKDAQSLVDGLTYIKAKNGLCFGIVTVERLDSNITVAINQMLVNVPCKDVGL